MNRSSTPHKPVHVATIVASTRPGRFGPVIANWFAGHVETRPEFTHDVIDLAEVDVAKAAPRGHDPTVAALLARIEAADAIVIVVPEYNHSYPASIKQVIDLSSTQWQGKVVGFVSYGGISGGLRATEHLRPVVATLGAAGVRNTLSFHNANRQFDDDGQPVDPEGVGVAVKAFLDELTWWAEGLRDARAAHPFPG